MLVVRPWHSPLSPGQPCSPPDLSVFSSLVVSGLWRRPRPGRLLCARAWRAVGRGLLGISVRERTPLSWARAGRSLAMRPLQPHTNLRVTGPGCPLSLLTASAVLERKSRSYSSWNSEQTCHSLCIFWGLHKWQKVLKFHFFTSCTIIIYSPSI